MPRRVLVLAPLLAVASCVQPAAEVEPVSPYDYQLADGEYGIDRLPYGEAWPDFSIGWQRREELLQASQNSLTYLSKPSSKGFFPVGANDAITHDRMVRSVDAFAKLLEESTSAEDFLQGLNADFEVWVARGRSATGDVFFTGYGTPILDGSLTRGGAYQYPLYKRPDDLAKADDGTILGRMKSDGGLVPYYTAAELRDNHHLDGLELVWLTNPYDAYSAIVQGSAIIRFEDGTQWEIGYDGNNGHEYVSVGGILIEEGTLQRSELSATKLRQYFADNPAEAERVLPMNPRYVFFRESSGGPFGCLGQPVTAMHSIATEKDIFPRAALVYVEVRLPDFDTEGDLVQRPVRFFALDQDRGGAIRSAGRCDVYMGLGDAAMAKAGHVSSRGRMYYLFL
ncbi:MAG: MltA domain-containing protein, partial [Planctomycetota bacterium]